MILSCRPGRRRIAVFHLSPDPRPTDATALGLLVRSEFTQPIVSGYRVNQGSVADVDNRQPVLLCCALFGAPALGRWDAAWAPAVVKIFKARADAGCIYIWEC
jgi:hypothetical protein